MEVSNDDSFTGQLHLGTITFAQMAPGLTVNVVTNGDGVVI